MLLLTDVTLVNSNYMTLNYKPAIAKGQLHILIINGEFISTTIAKEVLTFAKSRIQSKRDWKQLKECVRLGEYLSISGGN